MDRIYTIQAKAQRATLKGDLDKAISMLKSAIQKYEELLDSIDKNDEDNIELVKSIDKLKEQVARRVKELEVLSLNKKEIKEKKDVLGEKEKDHFKRQLIRLTNTLTSPTDSKIDQAILDSRQKLKILKINGNNIDLMTTPEQKLKYENDLLYKIQTNYDLKFRKFEKFYSNLIQLISNNDTVLDLELEGSDTVNEKGIRLVDDKIDDEKENLQRELEKLKSRNANLENEVTKLNNRWDELVESAKRRRERENNKKD